VTTTDHRPAPESPQPPRLIDSSGWLASLPHSDADERLGVYLALAILPLMLLGVAANVGPLVPSRLAVLLAWPIVVVLASRRLTGLLVAAYLVVGGTVLRVAGFPGGGRGSDVLRVVDEGIRVTLGGGNPYDHIYVDAHSPVSSMPYPPAQLLLHLPGHLLGGFDGTRLTEIIAAVAIMVLLGLIAQRVSWTAVLPALAVYAALPNLVLLSYDGASDTSAGAILLLAVLAVGWARSVGWRPGPVAVAGLIAGAALGTKQSTLFVVLLLAMFVWRAAGLRVVAHYLLIAGGLLAAISLPFLVRAPADYLTGLTAFASFHQDVFGWNIWSEAEALGLRVPEVASTTLLSAVVAVLVTAAAAVLQYRSLGMAVLAGVVVTTVVFVTARWTTHAYFAMVAPILFVVPALAVVATASEQRKEDVRSRQSGRWRFLNAAKRAFASSWNGAGRRVLGQLEERLERPRNREAASLPDATAGIGPDRLTLPLYVAALTAGLVLMVLVHTRVTGASDYGQWLMTARYYLGESTPPYRDIAALPPLVLAALALARLAIGDPVVTLLVFDVVLLTSLCVGFAFLGLSLFRTREAAFACVVVPLLMTDRLGEQFASGSLLQLGAVVLTLFSFAAFVQAGYASTRSTRWWWAGSVSLGLVGLSHVGTAEIVLPTGIGIALLSFLYRRKHDPTTSLTVLAPLVLVLLPLAAYWLTALLPAIRGYVNNPASVNYNGPDVLLKMFATYWLNFVVMAVGFVSIALGALSEMRRRVPGPYLVLALWTAAAWGSFLFAIQIGAGTAYPRFGSLLLVPLAVGAGGGLGSLSRWLARRFAGLHEEVGREGALVLLAVLAVSTAPFAVDHYQQQTAFYPARDAQSLMRAVAHLEGALPSPEGTVLADIATGEWLEGLTGRAALFQNKVHYQFRPGEWQRSVDADVLQNATAALTNEFFLVEYSGRAGSGAAAAPVNLVIAANHGGEFVDLLTLAHQDTFIGPQSGETSLASLSAMGTATTHIDTEATIRTEWRGSGSTAAISFARTVRLARADPTLWLTDATPSGETSVLYPAPGIAFTSVETRANQAHVCFSRRGTSVPCLDLAVLAVDAAIERSEGGGLLVRGAAGGLELQITDLTAGGAFVGLGLLDPRELVTKYNVGAAILDAYDPSYDETGERLSALGFRVSIVDGMYAVLLRDAPVSERLTP
jgi:hypothetical protein